MPAFSLVCPHLVPEMLMHPWPPQILGRCAQDRSSQPSFTPTTRAESKLSVSSGMNQMLAQPDAGTDIKLTEGIQYPSTCFRGRERHLSPFPLKEWHWDSERTSDSP